jgi:transcriptional regulator GlxA family with amidase domain
MLRERREPSGGSTTKAAPHPGARTRRVVMLAFPDVQILDVVGPLEVFARATRWLAERPGAAGPPAYAIEIVGERRGALRSSSGIRLEVDRPIRDVGGSPDTLIVAGGIGTRAALGRDPVIAWLRRMAPRVRRLASVCTGAFLLAEAGLLDGLRVTTHWRACRLLAERHPKLTVDPEPIFIRQGRITTSAGVTAGMDLALAFVEEDLGHEVALAVARELVLFLRRPGGQSQFSAQLAAQAAEREPIRDLLAWIADHPGEDLSVESLAAEAGMSPRNFARVFAREVGTTPARYVERARVEAARRRLEESRRSLEEIAAACGFASADVFRRAFARTLHVTPAAYRTRFRRRAAPAA